MNTLQLIPLVNLVFVVLQVLVFARVIISWIPVPRYHPLVRFINQTTEPLLRPFRAVIAVGRGGIDFSPLILFFILGLIRPLIVSMLRG